MQRVSVKRKFAFLWLFTFCSKFGATPTLFQIIGRSRSCTTPVGGAGGDRLTGEPDGAGHAGAGESGRKSAATSARRSFANRTPPRQRGSGGASALAPPNSRRRRAPRPPRAAALAGVLVRRGGCPVHSHGVAAGPAVPVLHHS